jgi:hypothetical protein
MQGAKSLSQNAQVGLSLVDCGRLQLQVKQAIHGELGRADRIFDGEHHVVGQLAELAHEREVVRSSWYDRRPVALIARQKLARDEWHHAGNANARVQYSGRLGFDP